MNDKDWDLHNIATGYIKRADGSWIANGMATPADMCYHFLYFNKK